MDASGNYGYIKAGADSVTPFRTGNASVSQVLSGYTFANATSPNLTGAMTNNGDTTKSATYSLDTTNSRVVATVPANAYYNTSSKLYATYSSVRTLIGLTAEKIASGNTILGISGTAGLQPTKFNTILESNTATWDGSKTISGFVVGKIVVITAYMISTGSDRYISISSGMTSWKTSCIMVADYRHYTFIGIATSSSISFSMFGQNMFKLAGYFT